MRPRTTRGAAVLAAASALLLAAAGPPPAAPAATAPPPETPVAPDQWGIIANLPDGSCGARLPPAVGLNFDIMLAPDNSVSIILGNATWKNATRTYEVIMRLDDFQPFGYSMLGKGPALIGAIPPEFRAEFMTAGRISIGFNGGDYTMHVHDVAGVVARLDTCVQARRAASAAK
jgi:hypothetical protein